jgi:ribulose-phosphate 3-epimerase
MIVEPEKHVADMRNAGADLISFHLETTPHAQRLLGYVKSLGAKAGIALDPQTPVALLTDLIADIDLILIMSVNPGYSGQAYIPNSVKKVREARRLIDAHNPACELEIDGGIGRGSIADVVAAGVDAVVMGSSIFGARDPAAELRALRALVESDGLSGGAAIPNGLQTTDLHAIR